eukprot:323218-Hanusia_phi.AAC.1
MDKLNGPLKDRKYTCNAVPVQISRRRLSHHIPVGCRCRKPVDVGAVGPGGDELSRECKGGGWSQEHMEEAVEEIDWDQNKEPAQGGMRSRSRSRPGGREGERRTSRSRSKEGRHTSHGRSQGHRSRSLAASRSLPGKQEQ